MASATVACLALIESGLTQDMQAEKLKEQLRNMLMERKREAKKAFDMAGAWSKDTASRPAGRLAKRSNDSTIKAWSHHE